MKVLVTILLFIFTSCGQDFNSSSFDESKFRNADIDDSTPEGQRFSKAYDLIDAKCTSCHNSHDEYSSYITSDDWVAVGLISPGDFENSFIIQRLKNYGGDMPKGASALSADEIEILREWIEGLSP